jgi:patatin-like phospholipase/acyl hydrolase
MQHIKPRSIQAIEDKISSMPDEDIRRSVLESAKQFKTSWISFGQSLFSVWKDKLYKQWGYDNFESYTKKEIGIRKQTATKLLRSYYFLEREDPAYLQKDYNNETDTALVPTYESIDVLRLASKKRELTREDYGKIKRSILEMGKDSTSAKKDLVALMRQREELQPEEVWQKKRTSILKRLLTVLKSVISEARVSNMLSVKSLDELEKIASKIESETT